LDQPKKPARGDGTQPIDLTSAEEIAAGGNAPPLRRRVHTRQLEAAWFAQGQELEEEAPQDEWGPDVRARSDDVAALRYPASRAENQTCEYYENGEVQNTHSMPMSNGGNAYRVDRQAALLDDARERSQEAMRGISLEVAGAYEAAQAAQRQVESWSRGRRSSRRWFIAAMQGRDVGATEPRDLVDAARAYLGARFSHLSAIHDFNVALANLERSTGTRVTRAWEPPCE